MLCNFQTIESILKPVKSTFTLRWFSVFPDYWVYFKACNLSWASTTSIRYFQTIESILKPNMTIAVLSLPPHFQTIESILKPKVCILVAIELRLFPDYWVYFKANWSWNLPSGAVPFPDYWVYFKAKWGCKVWMYLKEFPDYWVYFKALASWLPGRANPGISRLLSLF